MSVRLSAWNNSVPTFMKFDTWRYFVNLSRKFKSHSNLTRITGALHDDRCRVLIISGSVFLRMGNIAGKICRENQNTHFVFVKVFSRISCRLWDNVETRCRAGQATDDNMAHAHCKLDTWDYKHTLTMYKTYCCSTTTTVARRSVNVTSHVHCLSCLYFHRFLGPRTSKQCPSRPTAFRKTKIQGKISLSRFKHLSFFHPSKMWKVFAAFVEV
jgi:hypothetical protein